MALYSGSVVGSGILAALMMFGVGCSGSQPRAAGGPAAAGGGEKPPRIVALIENTPVGVEDLAPSLFEMAGREALRERVIDHALRAELERNGLTVSAADVERERALFEERMSRTGDERAGGLIGAEVYRTRALGPERRRTMFWRNAALRMLATETEPVTGEEIDAAMELAYGPKVIARLILAETERDAGEALRALGPTPSVSDFARVAEQRSIDPTGARGGRLPPVHLADANYPLAVRDALAGIAPGVVSPIIPLASGAAVVMVEGREAAQTPPPDAEARLERELGLQRERAAMEALARRLVSQTRVDVLDRSLGWSWEGE